MLISVIGTGYVGLVTAAGLAELGHDVVCVDKDQMRVDAVNRGESFIYEQGLDELVARHAGHRLRAVSRIADAVASTELTIITVDTPFVDGKIGLESIKAVATEIGRALAAKSAYHVVVVKSTVTPGTTDSVVLPLLEAHSGKAAGRDFGVGMSPEFLREGQAVADFLNPDRIVLGGIDDRSWSAMDAMFQSFGQVELVRTSTRTAEMIKYASNALLATLISYSNEIANLSSALSVDSSEVMHGVHLDRRLTPTQDDGTRLRPGILAYIEPGCGFGGSCFPKDVRSLVAFGQEHGLAMRLLDAVMAVNEAQPHRLVDLLRLRIPDLAGVKVAVLGSAFKPGTDDVRESPGVAVALLLLGHGARVTLVDPVANDRAAEVLGDRVSYSSDLKAATEEADAVVLTTAWPEFRELPTLFRERANPAVVVDGRRFFSKEDFLHYEAIGL